jgi:hypothetical protein
MSQVIPSQNTFLTMHANILIFLQWAKNVNRHRAAINQPLTGRNRREREEDLQVND